MVERLLCKQDVSGSSPLTSTKREKSQEKKAKIQHCHQRKMRMLDFRKSSNRTLKTA